MRRGQLNSICTDYDKAFTVSLRGASYHFDSFACAIHKRPARQPLGTAAGG